MLGRYRIERELGRGGMGVVYVATDINTDRHVALKTTSVAGLGSGEKTRNQRRERFIREVRALTQVNHPNVVHVFDAGEIDDADLGWLLFYTMEYVEGTTLAALVQEHGALNGGEAAAVVAQVAHGLGEAHRQGIIHRDVKPANIFLSDDGRALIGDFGIAKIEGSTQITRRDQLVGTPNYLAPEQILGEDIGAYTDVFALGALFYVITQNRPLRQQVDAGSLLASANGNDPVARMLEAGGLSDALRRVVARALERDPARRWVDGAAFADALAEHATRVPMGQQRPTFLNDGTLDRSNAFLSTTALPGDSGSGSDPDGDNDSFSVDPNLGAGLADGDFGSVEAAARAMLGEVERRSTGTFKQPAVAEPKDALPVARTESTVMFNLRAIEDIEPRSPSSPSSSSSSSSTSPSSSIAPPMARDPASGPVSGSYGRPANSNARAESTLVVKRKASIAMEPVTDEDDDGPRSSPKLPRGIDGLTDDDAVQPPVSTSGSPLRPAGAPAPNRALVENTGPTLTGRGFATPPTTLSTRPMSSPAIAAPPRAPLPRAAQLSIVAIVGAVLGFSIAALTAPRDVLADRPASGATATTSATSTTSTLGSGPRPEICAPREVSAEDQARALQALDEARQLKSAGGRSSLIIEKLREGIGYDPTNAQLFYDLGRLVSTPKEMDVADACVCALAPTSTECKTLQKIAG
ncbi:MAG TPA: serine/threonine-protein kinase [Myxococcota bacterium]